MWIGFTGKVWDREEGRVKWLQRPRKTLAGYSQQHGNNMEKYREGG